MPGKERALSYECIERFEAWARAHCPCAFDDPKCEFFRGLLFICEEEVIAAANREKIGIIDALKTPSLQ